MKKASLKRKIRKILSPFRRIGLKNYDFTIISNNCWGGVVYDILGLRYHSPTIGCFFYSKDYIKFCNNLKYYIQCELTEVNFNDSKYKEKLTKYNNMVIGKLDDIEIIFLHYENFEEAYTKWNRRCKRINYNNILIKYSDQNMFCAEDYEKFKELNFENKLFITAKKEYKNDSNVIFIKKYMNEGYAIDDIKLSLKQINLIKLLNKLR